MVNVANLTGSTQAGLTVNARTYDMTGNAPRRQGRLEHHPAEPGRDEPALPDPEPDAARRQRRARSGRTSSSCSSSAGRRWSTATCYWLSTINDVPAYTGNAYPNLTTYGDLRNLQTPQQDPINGLLSKTTSTPAPPRTHQSGLPDGQDTATDVTLTNRSSTVAFLVRVDVRKGSGTTPATGDNQVRPANYSDNYVTLWPGQSQTITETYKASDLGGQRLGGQRDRPQRRHVQHRLQRQLQRAVGRRGPRPRRRRRRRSAARPPARPTRPRRWRRPGRPWSGRQAHRRRRLRRRHGAGDAGADGRRAGDVRARSRPASRKDYTATTMANVISTAGDAALSGRPIPAT